MTAAKLDSIDLRILHAVQIDGRITKVKLAEVVGLSPTPCWNRLRKLEEAGIICGYHARIVPRKIASFSWVLMEVTLAAHRQADFDRFERSIRNIPEIVACWSVGGGVDYIVKIMSRDVDSYQRLVDRLLESEIGIERYFSYIVTRTVKDEAVLPIAELVHDRA